MKKHKIILIVLLLIFCTGCKRTHCPAWPSDLVYFPYSKNQELIFVNSQLDTQFFKIVRKENAKSESLDWNCHCKCSVFTLFSASSTPDSLNVICDINASGLEYPNTITIHSDYYIQAHNDLYHYKEFLQEVILPDRKISYKEIEKYLSDTLIIENEKNKIINRMVIVKNKGLVSYHTFDGEEWKLID